MRCNAPHPAYLASDPCRLPAGHQGQHKGSNHTDPWSTNVFRAIRPEHPLHCECHRESGSHEMCCGHQDGVNPDCPIHGDGSR